MSPYSCKCVSRRLESRIPTPTTGGTALRPVLGHKRPTTSAHRTAERPCAGFFASFVACRRSRSFPALPQRAWYGRAEGAVFWSCIAQDERAVHRGTEASARLHGSHHCRQGLSQAAIHLEVQRPQQRSRMVSWLRYRRRRRRLSRRRRPPLRRPCNRSRPQRPATVPATVIDVSWACPTDMSRDMWIQSDTAYRGAQRRAASYSVRLDRWTTHLNWPEEHTVRLPPSPADLAE